MHYKKEQHISKRRYKIKNINIFQKGDIKNINIELFLINILAKQHIRGKGRLVINWRPNLRKLSGISPRR